MDDSLLLQPCRSPPDIPHGVYLPMPRRSHSRSRSNSITRGEASKAAGPSSLSRHNSNKENEFPLQNPLMNVFGPNGVAKKVPLAPSQSKTNMNMESSTLTTSVKGEKKTKMRPGAAKNARNLCALRWHKHINSTGTTEEFRVYWDGLTAETREKYRLEAERLQKDGTWTKPSDPAACNGTIF